ncbi:hypothetical protein IAU59_000232 [Kwoniella sp. CBS 9459]
MKIPLHDPVPGLSAPKSSRRPTEADFTLLAARGGEIEFRLDDSLQAELKDVLRRRIDRVSVDPVMSSSATAFNYLAPVSSLNLEKGLQGLVTSYRCPLVRRMLTDKGQDNRPTYLASREVDFEGGRFLQTGSRNQLEDDAEVDKWSDAAFELSHIRTIRSRDVTAFVDNRDRFPPVLISGEAVLPYELGLGSALPDIVYSLPYGGPVPVPKVLFVVELKLDSVLKDSDFEALVQTMESQGGVCHLSLVRLEHPGEVAKLRVYSELDTKWTDIICQVYSGLCISKARMAHVSSGQQSVVFEYGNSQMRLSKPIKHSDMSLLEILGALALALRTSAPVVEYDRTDILKPFVV